MNDIQEEQYDPHALLLDLRKFLRKHNVQYSINDWGDDDIIVSFATAGSRYEVCFDSEMVFWSVFEGRELQETELSKLKSRIVDAKS